MNKILPFAVTWMILETVILSNNGQRHIIWYLIYVESKKGYKWSYLQNRSRVTNIENKLKVTR